VYFAFVITDLVFKYQAKILHGWEELLQSELSCLVGRKTLIQSTI